LRAQQAIQIDDSAGNIQIGFVNGRITICRKYRCARQSTKSNSGRLFHESITRYPDAYRAREGIDVTQTPFDFFSRNSLRSHKTRTPSRCRRNSVAIDRHSFQSGIVRAYRRSNNNAHDFKSRAWRKRKGVEC
jgi:hypothetical protein